MTSTSTEFALLQDWFAGSRVVDESGRPLLVYHGSRNNADIASFSAAYSQMDPGERGIYFTSSITHANDYATDWGEGDASFGGVIYPAYLRILNPYEVTAKEWGQGIGSSPEEAREQGFDGFVIRGQEDGDTYIVFHAEQVRSALSNREPAPRQFSRMALKP